MTPPPAPLTIVIPSYNGEALLRRHFPSVLAAAAAYRAVTKIIVVDDGSTDGSVAWLAMQTPAVMVLENGSNLGFATSVNRGMQAAATRLVLLLNNDITLARDFIAPLAGHFADPQVFAVSAASRLRRSDNRNEGVVRARITGGLLLPEQPALATGAPEPSVTSTNLHASGGFSIFDRDRFLALGGFDPLFVIHEDIDFSLRAWQRGWLVLYEPRAICHHDSQSTMRTLHREERFNRLDLRNKLLTSWRNLTSPGNLLAGLLTAIRLLASPDPTAAGAARAALAQLPAVLRHRLAEPPPRWSDPQLLDLTANRPYHPGRLLAPGLVLIDPCGAQKGLNPGLAYLAAAVRQAGYRTRIIDLNNDSPHREKIVDLINTGHFRFAGFSVKTATLPAATALARELKRRCPGLVTIAGGPHVTIDTTGMTGPASPFDYLVAGEGEESLPALLRCLQTGAAPSIPGVSAAARGGALTPALVADLDTLPLPDYSDYPATTVQRFGYPLVTSRGCPYQCVFCTVGAISGARWRARRVPALIAELTAARRQFGFTEFTIVDDNFTFDTARAEEFCRQLLAAELKLRWLCGNGIRADKLTPHLAELMARSGCHTVMLGIETGSEPVFARLQKGETLADISRAIALLKEAHIRVGGFFLLGLPGQSYADFLTTMDFIRATGLAWAHFGYSVPYPGTELRRWLEQSGCQPGDCTGVLHFQPGSSPLCATPDFSRPAMRYAFAEAYLRQGVYDYLVDQRWPVPLQRLAIAALHWRHNRAGGPPP